MTLFQIFFMAAMAGGLTQVRGEGFLSGMVVDQDQTPLSGCSVNLAVAGKTESTRAGAFAFTDLTPVQQAPHARAFSSRLSGGSIWFQSPGKGNIRMDLYEVNGRHIENIINSRIPAGSYLVYPPAYAPVKGDGGLYLVRIICGTSRAVHMLTSLPGESGGRGLSPAGPLVKGPRRSDVKDTLVVQCRGCAQRKIGVRSYHQDLGEIAVTAHAALDFREVVFAVREPRGPHWYENFGYAIQHPINELYGSLGQLCKYNVYTGVMDVLLEDLEGAVRDPQVHYDARKILFSYRPGGTGYFHLYEINIDGTGLTQLTRGPWDDIEPTYVPDGGIIFCSSRAQRWVPCWHTQVATLHRCNGDGSGIRMISSNVEQDNTPWMLPDGRVMYTRWEYVDRSRQDFHHLWSMNPDGTGQMIWFGNMRPRNLLIDAKPLPGHPQKVAAILSPAHGREEHMGEVATVSAELGPDALESLNSLTGGNSNYRDPYPVSEDSLLVAEGTRLMMMDGAGATRQLYALSNALADAGAWIHEPRPLRPRPREPAIPPAVDLADSAGQIIVMDIYIGRNMEGIPRGSIKKLLIMENLPKPVNYGGSMDPVSFGGSYTLNRVLGTVPVESDGSVNARVPPLRSLQLVALDGNHLSVKRMLSFLTVMPGERNTCLGCHEDRTMAPPVLPVLQALQRPPSEIEKIPGAPDVFDYHRDIQPIWDRHCLACHDVDKYDGRVLMTGDQGPIFTHSYYDLSARLQMADGRDLARGNYAPYTIGSYASYLMNKVDGTHYGVTLEPGELRMVKLWIDASATFPGTYAALGSGMIGSYAELQYGTKPDIDLLSWPGMGAAREVMERRCASCHTGGAQLPATPKDNMGLRLHHLAYNQGLPRFWDPPWVAPYGDGSLRPGSLEWMRAFADPKLRFSRHKIYNLTRPDKSVQLLAPLAASAGGYAICGGIFTSTGDPDFQSLLTAIREARDHLKAITRFNMPGFKPEPEYIREMMRFGILPPDFRYGDPVDVYDTDMRYWESMWHRPEAVSVGTGVKRKLKPYE